MKMIDDYLCKTRYLHININLCVEVSDSYFRSKYSKNKNISKATFNDLQNKIIYDIIKSLQISFKLVN